MAPFLNVTHAKYFLMECHGHYGIERVSERVFITRDEDISMWYIGT